MISIINDNRLLLKAAAFPVFLAEICLLTNAKRVASVRAETYCNLYSLDRVHFLSVLEHYPLMRRTMESIAAERLSKIGKNPALVSTRDTLKDDLSLVKEIVSSATPDVSDSESEHEPPPPAEKEKRRKSVVKLGLQKLGLTKSKNSSSHAHTEKDESVGCAPKPSLGICIGGEKGHRSSSSCFGSPLASPTSHRSSPSPTPTASSPSAQKDDDHKSAGSSNQKETFM